MGEMEVRTVEGAPLALRSRKTRAVLAVLALNAPRPVLREQLAALLWSRRDRDQARASLRQSVHELVEALAPAGSDIVRADRNHLSLRSERIWTDISTFSRARAWQSADEERLTGESAT
jgi:DNA-binding SARP family transcriptional activator